ncbi:MAG: hypothetical protein JEZ08_16580 [Clostridiales bacterium]|nr:hypothetical protein [Clostridiales bacterium]
MKLLRSKIFRFLFVIILAVVMFTVKTYVEQQASSVDTTKEVYVVTDDFDTKHKIRSGDVKGIEVSILSLPKYYIDDKDDVVDKYIIDPVTEGSFVLTSNLTDDKHFEDSIVPEGYNMVSVPLNIDEAAGWKFDINQTVDMVFSPYQYTTNDDGTNVKIDQRTSLYKEKVIKNLEIVDVINEALVSISSKDFEGVPKYVVFLVEEEDAQFIAMAKDKGRFDILVKGN